LTLPVVVVAALAGLLVGRARLRVLRPDPWLAAAALGVFAVYAAPVVLSGKPTFAGVSVLPDTAHQLSLAWMLPRFGPDVAALPEGALQDSVGAYFASEYPMAAQAAFGTTAPFGVLDLAWLYQPFLTMIGVVGCLAVVALVAPWLESPRRRAVMAFVVAQPALVVAFALQGSIKELAGVWLIVTGVAVAAEIVRTGARPRGLLPLGVVAGAAVGALGPTGGLYFVVMAVVFAVAWLVRQHQTGEARLGRTLLWFGAAAAVAAVACLPVLDGLGQSVSVGRDLASQDEDLGNLADPLSLFQALGVWLSGDYRFRPETALNAVLVAVTAALAIGGAVVALRRAMWGALLLAGTGLVVSAVLLAAGSPYTDAKVLMILSPALLLLAALGASAALRSAREAPRWARVLSVVPALALTAGVVGSNALAYHDVTLAPYDRYSELLEIDERLAETGPVLVTEYDEYLKYLLRDVPGRTEPEWGLDYNDDAFGGDARSDARRPSIKTPHDPDDLVPESIASLGFYITRRSPVASRPVGNLDLWWRGRYYEIWRRSERPEPLVHVPFGKTIFQAGGRAGCTTVERVAREAEAQDGVLRYVERRPVVPFVTGAVPLPAGWRLGGGYPGAVVPTRAGRLESSVEIPQAGTYRIWVEGSFGRAITITVDGKRVGEVAQEIGNPGQWFPIEVRDLPAGRHTVVVEAGRASLAPGQGGSEGDLRHVGIIDFQPVADEERAVRTIPASRWRTLCGQWLDWIEAAPRG
ncbi:MAG TPA: hypothetical protein VN238_06470, partial [Solirubrobacteraceae bacterium]|nr:hypothetical protein [Solirubrobacteraceae bacterium]